MLTGFNRRHYHKILHKNHISSLLRFPILFLVPPAHYLNMYLWDNILIIAQIMFTGFNRRHYHSYEELRTGTTYQYTVFSL